MSASQGSLKVVQGDLTVQGNLTVLGNGGSGPSSGVSSIVAGTGVSISPATGLGAVTINSTGIFSMPISGTDATFTGAVTGASGTFSGPVMAISSLSEFGSVLQRGKYCPAPPDPANVTVTPGSTPIGNPAHLTVTGTSGYFFVETTAATGLYYILLTVPAIPLATGQLEGGYSIVVTGGADVNQLKPAALSDYYLGMMYVGSARDPPYLTSFLLAFLAQSATATTGNCYNFIVT